MLVASFNTEGTRSGTVRASFTGITVLLPYIQMVLSVGTGMASVTGKVALLLFIQMVCDTGTGMASVTGMTGLLSSVLMVVVIGTVMANSSRKINEARPLASNLRPP
jgi:hypothetical protein